MVYSSGKLGFAGKQRDSGSNHCRTELSLRKLWLFREDVFNNEQQTTANIPVHVKNMVLNLVPAAVGDHAHISKHMA